jgi:hypothetical protein
MVVDLAIQAQIDESHGLIEIAQKNFWDVEAPVVDTADIVQVRAEIAQLALGHDLMAGIGAPTGELDKVLASKQADLVKMVAANSADVSGPACLRAGSLLAELEVFLSGKINVTHNGAGQVLVSLTTARSENARAARSVGAKTAEEIAAASKRNRAANVLAVYAKLDELQTGWTANEGEKAFPGISRGVIDQIMENGGFDPNVSLPLEYHLAKVEGSGSKNLAMYLPMDGQVKFLADQTVKAAAKDAAIAAR